MLFISFTFLIGCQNNDEDHALQTQDQNDPFVQVKDSDPKKNKPLNNKDIAVHLAHIASRVPNVNDTVAIIAGPYAVVGIDVDATLDRSRVGTIKYSVSEALRDDPYGKTAVVIADGDIIERIRSMGTKMNEGYPVQGIIDELSAIVGRYMPNFPVDENQPLERDENKQILPEEDEDQLDDIQKEQSEE